MFALVFNSACGWWSAETPNANANTNVAKDETVTTPPFTTKEPESFQAKMVVTSSLGAQMPSPAPLVYEVARNGDKRRVEFEKEGEKVALIQTPSGQVVLNLSKKEYAEFKQGGKEKGGVDQPNANSTADNPLERILNQPPVGAKYEKLGQEEVNGRMATKYRVTTRQAINTGEQNEQVSIESFIWIDESLGMPIKSQTTYRGQNGRTASSTMEVRDIKLETPPASMFEIPKGYKKVED
jgi:outer membrane lipoprotein-sorting protein